MKKKWKIVYTSIDPFIEFFDQFYDILIIRFLKKNKIYEERKSGAPYVRLTLFQVWKLVFLKTRQTTGKLKSNIFSYSAALGVFRDVSEQAGQPDRQAGRQAVYRSVCWNLSQKNFETVKKKKPKQKLCVLPKKKEKNHQGKWGALCLLLPV